MNTTTLHIIKKYANRRLYDTEVSRYITLDDIKQYVLDNISFQVIDAKLETDITKSTLFQIIANHEESGSPTFSSEILQHIIRSYGDNLQNVLSGYIEQVVSFFIQKKDFFEQQQQTSYLDWTNASIVWMKDFYELQKKFWASLDTTPEYSTKQQQKNNPPASKLADPL